MANEVLFEKEGWEVRDTRGQSGVHNMSLYYKGEWNITSNSYHHLTGIAEQAILNRKVEKLEAEVKRLRRKANRLVKKNRSLKEQLEIGRF